MSAEGSLFPPSNLLPQNAINAITIDGLVFRRVGVRDARLQIPATLQRMKIPTNLIDACPHPDIAHILSRRAESCYEPNGPIPRPPSQLGPPDHSTLSFSLGKPLGAGRSGLVYEVLEPHLEESTSETPSARDPLPSGYLPPLVIKIARQNSCQSIVREGWFYEEMECLQGVTIPRCYGCFELKLPKGCRVGPWEDPRFGSLHRSMDAIPEFEKYVPDVYYNADVFPHPLLPRLVIERKTVYVLLLERLGNELQPNVQYPNSLKDDILSLYEDVSNLGITLIDDIRPSNILSAPLSPPGIPSVPSPFTDRTHDWRVIDFERALKTPWTKELVFGESASEVKVMLEDLWSYRRHSNLSATGILKVYDWEQDWPH